MSSHTDTSVAYEQFMSPESLYLPETSQDIVGQRQVGPNALLFVDTAIDDYQSLVSNIAPVDSTVVLLDSTKDGVAQISETIAQYAALSSVQIFSHGSSGKMQLGATELSLSTLEGYQDEITGWSQTLTDDADILLYACNLAAGTEGGELIATLAELTGADVAASDNLTGSSALGGDWQLEVSTGSIETGLALQAQAIANYTSVLALPQNGVVLHLEADSGVTTDSDGIVTIWNDQSASGNDLAGSGDPRLVTGELNGHDVVRFDDAGDKLERIMNLNDLPGGNADRSVFMVAKYNSAGYGGFAYGDDDFNQTFGLIVDPLGELVVQGWGKGNDQFTGSAGTGQGWLSQAAILESGTLSHFKNGAVIDVASHDFNTDLQQLVLGAEIDSAPYVDMDVAEIIVYDRALSESEQNDVQDFLAQKYGLETVRNDYIVQTNPEFVNEQVVGGLTLPIDSVTLPDGQMLVLEKGGAVKILDPQAANPVAAPYLTLNNINTAGERGLISIALDPSFEANGFFYLYYAYDAQPNVQNPDIRFRISRFVHDVDHAHVEEEKVVWEANEDIIDSNHYGGSFGFGPDGYLYIATGDIFNDPASAQDLTSWAGKVIRLDPSGVDGPGGEWVRGGNNDHLIPDDNFGVLNDPNDDILDEIWAYGLRNAFRGGWDLGGEPGSERFYIGEVGGNDQATAMEDLHVATVADNGANFGWDGSVEGFTGNPAFSDPLYSYNHAGASPNGGAIVGGTVYRGDLYPSIFEGAYFFADYVQGWIRYLQFDDNGNIIDAVPGTPEVDAFNFDNSIGGLVSLREGPEGALYYTDLFSGQLRRIAYNGSGNLAPTITTARANTTSGAPDLAVTFTGAAIDPEDDELSYLWDFGFDGDADGMNDTSTDANPTYTYTDNGAYTARLTVSDGINTTNSEPIQIAVGSAPVVNITTNQSSGFFRAGETLTATATATDDGPLDESSYEWDVRFIHNAHFHTEISDHIGSSVSHVVETTNHDFSDATGFEFSVTVTDSDGLQTTEVISLFPEKVDLTFNSNLPGGGIDLTLDGFARTGPFIYDTAIDFEHTIAAPEVVAVGGDIYTFDSWSYGSDTDSAEQVITVPDANQTITANYINNGAAPLPSDGLVLHLDANLGVSTDGDTVTEWTDLSGSNNDLSGLGDPTLVTGALNGQNVIELDGDGDQLSRTLALNGLPDGNADRSLFVVAKYDGTGTGGVTYGDNRTNRAFGAVVDGDGTLLAQGWGGANDFDSNVAGTGEGWLLQGLVHEDGTLSHYKDGVLIDTQAHAYNTRVIGGDGLVIGSEIDGAPFVDMNVAEVIIYDRALSETEQQQVQSYLQDKYFGSTDGQPVAALDNATTTANVPLLITEAELLSNDELGDTPTTITDVDTLSANNGTIVDNADGTYTYRPADDFVGQDTFNYTITDIDGDTSSAVVIVEVSAADSQPIAVDDSATTGEGNAITLSEIALLNNDSLGDEPTTITAVDTTSTEGGVIVDNADGSYTYTPAPGFVGIDSFDYTIADTDGDSSTATVSVEVVDYLLDLSGYTVELVENKPRRVIENGFVFDATATGGPSAHFHQPGTPAFLTQHNVGGNGVQINFVLTRADGSAFSFERFDYTSGLHFNGDVNAGFTVTGTLADGGEISQRFGPATSLDMFETALLSGEGWQSVTAVRFLGDRIATSETDTITQELNLDNLVIRGLQPVAVDDTATTDQDIPLLISKIALLNNDSPGNGPITLIEVDSTTSNNSTIVDNADGTLTYTPAAGFIGTDTFNYVITDANGDISVATVTVEVKETIDNQPLAVADSATTEQDVAVVLNAVDLLSNDDLGDAPTTITAVDTASVSGGAIVDNADGTYTYTPANGFIGQDTFDYVITDADGDSSTATVSVNVVKSSSLPLGGLVVRLDAGTGVTTDGNGVVTQWSDQSGLGNDVLGSGNPTLLTGALNGRDVIELDGSGDTLTRLLNLNGLPTENANRSLFIIAKYDGFGYGGVTYGDNRKNRAFGAIVDSDGSLGVQGWGTSNDFDSGVAGTGSGWLMQEVIHDNGVMSHYKDGMLIDSQVHTYRTDVANGEGLFIGSELDGTPFVDMNIAEVLIYDRALSDTERQQVEGYLQDKYFGSVNGQPVAGDDTAVVDTGGAVNINVLSDDSFGTDGPGTNAITLSTLAANGTATLNDGGTPNNPVDDTIDYVPDEGFVGQDSFAYTITDADGDTSTANVTVEVTNSNLPVSGLVVHLDSAIGVTTDSSGVVTGWADQSGSGNDLIGFGDPMLETNALNGHSVIKLDGSQDKLARVLSLNDLPEGNAERSLFLVTKYNGNGIGGATYGDNRRNRAFGAVTDSDGTLMVQGWGGMNDFDSNVTGTGDGWLLQEVVYDGNTLNHYKNGSLIDTRIHTYATDVANGNGLVIGGELDGTPFVDMEVAALLIYDRALSETERQQVESYLQGKYFGVSNSQSTAITDGANTEADTAAVITEAEPLINDGLDLSSYTVELVENKPRRVLENGFVFDATATGGPSAHFHQPGTPAFLTQHNVGGNGVQINFVLTRADGSAFSFERFDYTSGLHFNGDVNAGFTVVGTLADGGEISQRFGPATSLDTFETALLSGEGWQSVTAVRFLGDRIATSETDTITQELNLDNLIAKAL
ncbi:PKD domain protein [Synechococcus sp. PCC 7335]|uniref:Ig-like domain-containing protein n=1 Tax=Synechococcus sp. (strain ATCC 29403 / PCC 7335) TaxID=91464 RepID=UPI00017EB7D1|nr:tandem-95 repeat protein [Synechococcus sp. PCC 7335]EDX87629.1 PKD domain protein [Synechococcus sp. PCC 7335]